MPQVVVARSHPEMHLCREQAGSSVRSARPPRSPFVSLSCPAYCTLGDSLSPSRLHLSRNAMTPCRIGICWPSGSALRHCAHNSWLSELAARPEPRLSGVVGADGWLGGVARAGRVVDAGVDIGADRSRSAARWPCGVSQLVARASRVSLPPVQCGPWTQVIRSQAGPAAMSPPLRRSVPGRAAARGRGRRHRRGLRRSRWPVRRARPPGAGRLPG
jgi:hypothetical protein